MNNTNNSMGTMKQTKVQKRKHTYWWVMSAIIIGALLYVFSPIDFIPDIIAGLGQIDDVLVAFIPVISHFIMFKKEYVAFRSN